MIFYDIFITSQIGFFEENCPCFVSMIHMIFVIFALCSIPPHSAGKACDIHPSPFQFSHGGEQLISNLQPKLDCLYCMFTGKIGIDTTLHVKFTLKFDTFWN
ncbi:hypothetical protein ACJX0J_014742 [Zea mays]